MTVAWMTYALLVGTLVALSAYAMDGVCRLVRRPTRWVWLGAMALAVALIVLAPRRDTRSEAVMLPMKIGTSVASVEAPQPTLADRVSVSLRRLRGTVENGFVQGFVRAEQLAPAPVARGIAALWVGASALAFLLFFGVHDRLRRARRAWPVAELHGARVRLAPDAGPAVVGLTHPEIVVPHWLLQRSDAEQRMVIAHEAEHLRARDPLLLSLACVAAAFAAWHPAMWWMLSRLRLAVELDCDDRIVRSGIAPRSYGALLIELAGRCSSGMRIGAPALADGSSHLERRLIAMTPRRPKFARTAACALAVCSAALFALACDAKLPTSEEVNSMNVSAAEGAAKRVALLGAADSSVVYTIDGRKATAEEAHALAADQIASIEVMKNRIDNGTGNEKASGEIHIITKQGAESLGVLKPRRMHDSLTKIVALVRKDSSGKAVGVEGGDSFTLTADTIVFSDGAPGGARVRRLQPLKGEPFNGVLLLNGVRVKNSELTKIAPGEIVSVEVLKGDAARTLYPDSAAANGVIRITTREKAKEPR
ncbi:MAG TPA: M56 family metallopeptidase [Gemmatimonadaceae bacterium]|nr:M56 family metallopeptidase [Gemmatimonadaceae bacterium]